MGAASTIEGGAIADDDKALLALGLPAALALLLLRLAAPLVEAPAGGLSLGAGEPRPPPLPPPSTWLSWADTRALVSFRRDCLSFSALTVRTNSAASTASAASALSWRRCAAVVATPAGDEDDEAPTPSGADAEASAAFDGARRCAGRFELFVSAEASAGAGVAPPPALARFGFGDGVGGAVSAAAPPLRPL